MAYNKSLELRQIKLPEIFSLPNDRELIKIRKSCLSLREYKEKLQEFEAIREKRTCLLPGRSLKKEELYERPKDMSHRQWKKLKMRDKTKKLGG